jgi:hypothetical protein
MIFLSASVPDPQRNPVYFNTADIVSIRDSVRALATVVVPNTQLVWGGHPAITPLIRYVMQTMKAAVQEHVTLYQSEYFRQIFPDDNQYIERVIITENGGSRDESLRIMRERMFIEHQYVAGIFIGGMEGVEAEFRMFQERHPKALLLPIASTGAAARLIYNDLHPQPNERLLNDYAYMALLKSVLEGVL